MNLNYTTNRINIKKIIAITVTAIIVIPIIILLWDTFVTKKVVTLKPSNNTTISITSKSNGKTIVTTQSNKKIRLRSGVYVIKFSAGNEYQDKVFEKKITKSTEIANPELSYSKNRLSNLLKAEQAAIQNALKKEFNISNYQISNESLYIHGDWYSARLVPNSWYDPNVPADYIPRPVNINNQSDILVVIMHKENVWWKLAATPSVVYWKDNYPNIPDEVIRESNKPIPNSN